jgi:hypothetical protein
MNHQTDRDRQEFADVFEKLELLRPTPARDTQVEARARAAFYAEVETSIPQTKISWIASLLGRPSKAKGNLMNTKTRFAFSGLVAVILLAVFLFSGFGVTAYASQNALPGDALYGLKTGIEQTRVSLSRNAATQARLHLNFAERRLNEIAALIEQGRFNRIEPTAVEFQYHVQQALQAVQILAQQDPQLAQELNLQISQALARYAQMLDEMLSRLPTELQPALLQALDASRGDDDRRSGEFEVTGTIETIDGDLWTIGTYTFRITAQTEVKGQFTIGNRVKVHLVRNTDGSLIAREIEAGFGDDNGNSNTNNNDNDNDNDNGNINGNDNVNDNLNTNVNDNENDNINTNVNTNTNTNVNVNTNTNDNDNDNSNTNTNTNTNWNSNTNDNDNDDDDDDDD